jgi:putative holliday junction resolvase
MSLALTPQRGSVLAFDFGLKRIGVAVGDWENRLAHALETISGEGNDQRFGRIAELIEEWRPLHLVCGLPFSMDGTEHDISRRARRFANQLNGRFALPVTLVDERLTSFDADLRLREAGVKCEYSKSSARKGLNDQLAAQQILQDFFDHAQATTLA